MVIPTCGTLDDHLRDVGLVLDKLVEAGLAIKPSKFWLAMKEAPYLGFLVGGGGTRPQPEKVAALLDMACEDMAADPSAAARYSGMIGFYHRYLPGLHSVLAPFHELKGKGADARHIMHSLRFKAAFAYSKHQLAAATALARPDYSKPFYIDVDMASSTGAGAILSQRDVADDPDSHRVLAFWSRRFSSEERRYGVRDQECMGLVDSLEVWRHFAVGTRVIVRTDHKSLEWLLTTPHRDGTRVQGFAHKLQGYNVEIQYVPGKDHVGADCMSRNMPPASRLSKEGGTERGRLDSRPSIQDRVDEAVGITLTANEDTSTPDTHFTVGHLFKWVSECCITRCLDATEPTDCDATNVTLHTDGEDSTPSTSDCLQVTSTRSIASRAFVFFVRQHAGGTSILLERQDQQLCLPSIAIEDSSQGSKRRQLSRRLQLTYRNADVLVAALQEQRAARHRFKPPGNARVTFYVAVLADDSGLPDTEGCSFEAVFHPATSKTFQQLTDPLDRAAAWYFDHRCLHAPIDDKASRGRQRVQSVLGAYTASVADSQDLPVDDRDPPRISESPYGPALIDDEESSALASTRLQERLSASPGLCISVDLEGPRLGGDGHICFIQVAVDGDGKAPALIYVFDIIRCGCHALGQSGTPTLRSILEDSSVPKVLHSCYGDVAALYRQFGIFTRHVFDTSVADSLCLCRPPNKSRGLKSVVSQWVGLSAQFTYKGSFVHTDSFWEVRPLLYYKFVYAYEDVIHCGQLYLRLRAMLVKMGLLDLALTLSQQRAPPVALRDDHPRYRPPTTVAVALVDAERVVCLQDPTTGRYFLPSLALQGEQLQRGTSHKHDGHADRKMYARAAWVASMGILPKQLRAAINNRMKKGVRIHDTLLYICTTADCGAALATLASSRITATQHVGARVVYKRQYVYGHSGTGIQSSQVTLFQYLHACAAQAVVPQSAVEDVFTVGEHDAHSPSIHIGAHLQVDRKSRVKLSLSLAVLAGCAVSQHSEPAIVANVSPRSDGVLRVGIILHDDTHFYAATRDKGLVFPSHGVEEDSTLEETAAKAFDLYAGVSLRKLPGVNSFSAQLLMPQANAFVRTAEHNAQPLGVYGNMAYFSWYVPKFGGWFLRDHEISLHASRRMVNGFQMVNKLSTKHPGFGLFRFSPCSGSSDDVVEVHSRALLAAFEKGDAKALLKALRRVATERDTTVPLGEALSATALTGVVPQHSEPHYIEWEASDEPPPCDAPQVEQSSGSDSCMSGNGTTYAVEAVSAESLGDVRGVDSLTRDDREQHALLIAATAYFAAILEARYSSVGHVHATPPVLTRDAIREAQLAHPATAQYVDYLKVGRALDEPMVREAFFMETASSLFLAKDGLLCIKSERLGAFNRIVLPPACRHSVFQLYHDFNGHLGVAKVLDFISQRFYWGPRDVMRHDIAEYIRSCTACAASKIPKHRAGEYNIISNGEHPNDVLSGDVFDVGVVFDEYSHTLDFVCHFTRRVTSTAVRGMPTAEGIAKVVIDVIIRHRGKPREIRSDRGSNFISAAIKQLYQRMHIKINAGTAHRHQLVALVERWHGTLKQLLLSQTAAGADDDWPSRLPLLELAYNAAHCDSIGYSPFFVDCLRQCILPMDSMVAEPSSADADLPEWVAKVLETQRVVYDASTRTLRQHALSAKKRYDMQRAVTLKLKPGDTVWAIRGEVMDKSPLAKATVPTEGPFVVARVLPHDRYVINNLRTRRIHNIMHIERLIPVPKYAPETSQWMLSVGPDGGKWPVRSIVDRRVKDGCIEYRVRWLGFPKSWDKWLSPEYLHSILDLVSLYDKRHGVTTPPLEVEPRASDSAPPPASPAAVARGHFRYGSTPAPIPTPVEPLTSVPETDVQQPSQNVQLPDTSDVFPIGTRVDVEFPREGRSWTGTVVKSRVYRPRTLAALPERIITVVWDDPAYAGEECEVGLTNSIVRRHRPPRAEPVCHNARPTDGQLLRRSTRLYDNGH